MATGSPDGQLDDFMMSDEFEDFALDCFRQAVEQIVADDVERARKAIKTA